MILHIPSTSIQLAHYGIPVPMLRDRVLNTIENIHKRQSLLIEDGVPVGEDMIRLAHSEEYTRRVLVEDVEECLRMTYELPEVPEEAAKWHELKNVMLTHVWGTLKASQLAYENGSCFFLGGGMHHAMSDQGRGFCLVNDIVITARNLIKTKKANHVWVIDVDAHKGDGTSQITADDPDISTFSIHMGDGWPFRSEDKSPWQTPSTVDVETFEGEDEKYIEKLKAGIQTLEDRAPVPDFVLFVLGADPYEHDSLPSTSTLNLSLEQLAQRDQFLVGHFKNKNVPMAFTMSGGYGPRTHEVFTQFINDIYLPSFS